MIASPSVRIIGGGSLALVLVDEVDGRGELHDVLVALDRIYIYIYTHIIYI